MFDSCRVRNYDGGMGETREDRIPGNDEAVQGKGVLCAYVNGFECASGAADAYLLFSLNGVPQVRLQMSYTLTKTLAQKLTEMVAKIETAGETCIKTTDEMKEGLVKLNAASQDHGSKGTTESKDD